MKKRNHSFSSFFSSEEQHEPSFGTIFGPQQQHGESFLPNIRSMKPFFSAMNSIAPRAPKILLNLLILDRNYGCSDNSLFR
jgi:hypothetical protein